MVGDIADLPTYVINMNERRDRWKRFTSQPAIETFAHLKRFSAVNGKKLRNYRRDRRLSIRTKLNISRNYRRSHYEIATLGAVGSSMSHIAIWKTFVASGAPFCIVLEDDAILTGAQLKEINDVRSSLPHGWGVWILGCYLPNLIVKPLVKPWTQVYNFTAAHAYMITRHAAMALLEEAFPIETHIEYYMTGASLLKDILMVNRTDINLEFFRKDGPRTVDSNTSQHKKTGCPTCAIPDDYTQLYRGYTRKTKKGVNISGVIDGEQSKMIRTFANTATVV